MNNMFGTAATIPLVGEFQNAADILKIVSDPAGAEKRFEKLKALSLDAKGQYERAIAEQAKLADKEAAHTSKLDAARHTHEERMALERSQLEAECLQRRRDLETREAQVTKREEQVTTREEAAALREADLKRRADQIAALATR